MKKQITRRVSANQKAKISAKQHFKSLLFGASLGAVVLLILLFGFFNERFIAPFYTPSKTVSSTSIIIDPTTTAVGPESKVIIPKINVEVPVVYDTNSIQEKDIQHALERGVVHYATTSSPGEKGNTVIFGHSSNNIFNGGKYKFAFVLLSKLQVGDTFILTKDGKRYDYRVYEKEIVKPTEVGVLGATDRPATATLITCDPPGTSLNRLVVYAEQISPDPATNATSTAVATEGTQPPIVPGNAPSLWSRFRDWLTG
jgi:sortase A